MFEDGERRWLKALEEAGREDKKNISDYDSNYSSDSDFVSESDYNSDADDRSASDIYYDFDSDSGQYYVDDEDSEKMNDVVRKKGKYSGKIVSIILIIAISAGSGYGGAKLSMSRNGGGVNSNIKISTNDNMDVGVAIAKKVTPTVVGIKASTEVEVETFFGTERRSQVSEGTGFIVDTKGYVMTNSHVIGDGKAKEIAVSLADGDEVKGEVLWFDKALDLAIVKINAKNLVAAELGDSQTVTIGAYAGAIGNPLGHTFERSYSQGVISGLNRSIEVKDESGRITKMDGLIQTDASINQGNSGGPLLNSKGQVIGINSAKAKNSEGMGFAIPINTAKPIIEKIKKDGKFKRSYIGISGQSVSDLSSTNSEEVIKDKLGTDTGVFVVNVYEGSPAEKAGIKEKDIILSINDKKIESINQMIKTLLNYSPGDNVNLRVMRDKKILKFKVGLTQEVE